MQRESGAARGDVDAADRPGPSSAASIGGTAPVSVVIPTIGRGAMLARCLESLARAEPPPSEVLVIDQSGDPSVAKLVDHCDIPGARHVACAGRGAARGVNRGLAAARHDVVLVTSDDCTVAPDWVGIAMTLMASDSSRLISGRVLPAGDPMRSPSIRTDNRPHSYAGRLVYDALSGNNLILNRAAVLAIGGFDERMKTAEDSDLCYRWLRAGGRIDYHPELLIVHHDWRTNSQLERLYVDYWRGGGWFYGKHLRAGDHNVIPLLLKDLRMAMRGAIAAVLIGKPRWSDPRRGFARGFLPGLLKGWGAGRRDDETKCSCYDAGRG